MGTMAVTVVLEKESTIYTLLRRREGSTYISNGKGHGLSIFQFMRLTFSQQLHEIKLYYFLISFYLVNCAKKM